MHGIIREPTETSEDSLFAYFRKKAERQEDASCVFLLWGSKDSESSPTWAVDVQITGLESEDKIFQKLAQQHSDKRGFLQKYLSFQEYDKLEPVTVCSIWLLSHLSVLTLNIVPNNFAIVWKILSFDGAFRPGQILYNLLGTARRSSRRDRHHYGLQLKRFPELLLSRSLRKIRTR